MRTREETDQLRLRVVDLWNAFAGTYTEIGYIVGESRGAVGRLLTEARARGIKVRRAGPPQIAQMLGREKRRTRAL